MTNNSSSESTVELDAEILDAIAKTLQEHGIPEAKIQELMDEFGDALAGAAYIHAARIFSNLTQHVPRTPGGEALYRYFVRDEKPIREAAREIGCSHVALLKAERKLRRFVGEPLC